MLVNKLGRLAVTFQFKMLYWLFSKRKLVHSSVSLCMSNSCIFYIFHWKMHRNKRLKSVSVWYLTKNRPLSLSLRLCVSQFFVNFNHALLFFFSCCFRLFCVSLTDNLEVDDVVLMISYRVFVSSHVLLNTQFAMWYDVYMTFKTSIAVYSCSAELRCCSRTVNESIIMNYNV